MARAALVPEGGRGRGVAVTGTRVWWLAGRGAVVVLAESQLVGWEDEAPVTGTSEGAPVRVGLVEMGALLTGAELMYGSMGSGVTAGEIAEAAILVPSVQPRVTEGSTVEVKITGGSVLVTVTLGGSGTAVMRPVARRGEGDDTMSWR